MQGLGGMAQDSVTNPELVQEMRDGGTEVILV